MTFGSQGFIFGVLRECKNWAFAQATIVRLSRTKRLLGYFRRYSISPSSIWLRQRDGWVELRRNEIAALKFETATRIIVRYYNGRRFIVSLYGFPNWSYDVVYRALGDSVRRNEQTRGLWEGAYGSEIL